MSNFINLTPHPIVLQNAAGESTTIAPSGSVARCAQTPGILLGEVNGIPVYSSPMTGVVEGLSPFDADPNAIYIVSGMVLAHPDVRGRDDVVGPGTGPADGAIRDDKGRIVAVTRLIQTPR